MALQPGQVWSGGNVLDADGRLVIVAETLQGSEIKTNGGGAVDQDGRLVVVMEAAQ